MKWNLRLTAANKGIWKASELQRSLAEHGLVISAGKMSGLWSGQPVSRAKYLAHQLAEARGWGRGIRFAVNRGLALVLTCIKTVHGHQRHDQLVSLRSLFTWAKRNGLIFRNPTSRIKVGQYEYAVLQPLVPDQVDRSVAAATTPATRLILALAAVHAARVAQIANLTLDDVDLGNRRLTIAGRVRPLDDLPRNLLLDRLTHGSIPQNRHTTPSGSR